MAGTIPLFQDDNVIVESVDSVCRDSAGTQYMLIQGGESEGGEGEGGEVGLAALYSLR